MKKLLTVLAIAISLSASAQQGNTVHNFNDTTKPKPKLYVLQGDVQSYEALLNALDESTAPHKTIEALKKWIVVQINQQLQPDKPKTGAKK